jgi:hypothetical protein
MKYNSIALVIMSVILISSCGQPQSTPEPIAVTPHDAFFQNLTDLCGATFIGASTYPDNPDHPLVDTELRTHISQCTDDMVRIELIRDGDYWHGAWVLEKRPEGLHLFHDHLGEVRTMEDLGEDDFHGYGGYANDSGTALRQHFPADAITAEIIPAAATNEWMMELDLENGTFVYYLERHQAPRFRAVLHKQE